MAIIVFSTKFGMGNRLIPKEIMKVMVLLGYLMQALVNCKSFKVLLVDTL